MWEGEFSLKGAAFLTPALNFVIAPANPNRVAIMFSVITGGSPAEVGPVGASGDQFRVIVVPQGRVEFLAKDWGPLVSGAWKMTNALGAGSIYVLELLRVQQEG